MRTTIDLDDDVLEQVKRRARSQHIPAGRLISDLLRRQLAEPPRIGMRNGIPVLLGSESSERISTATADEMILELLRQESGL